MTRLKCFPAAFALSCLVPGASAITYNQWLQSHFSADEILDATISGEDADPDGDHRGNLHEFISGSDPLRADGPVGPDVVRSGSGIPWVRFRWGLNLADAQALPQTSADLRHWITHNAWSIAALELYDTHAWLTWEWLTPQEFELGLSSGMVRYSRLGLLRHVGQSFLFPPTDLIAETAFASGGVHLRWSDNSPVEAGFIIERALEAGSPFTVLATVGPDTIGYTDPGGTWGTSSIYRVRAVGGTEQSLPTPAAVVLGIAGDDADGDGISDAWEILHFGGNANPNIDGDGDLLTNLQEYRLRTNPRSADSDGDGIPDGLEDPDGDGITVLDELAYGLSVGVDDTQQGGVVRDYSYDALGRLVIAGPVQGGAPGITYSYDPEGNLRKVGR